MDKWDYSDFWKETKLQIEKEISALDNSLWFSNISYVSSKEKLITLSVNSDFVKEQVVLKFNALILDKLLQLSGSKIEVEYIIAPADNSSRTELDSSEIIEEDLNKQKIREPRRDLQLSYSYTFENFVIGDNNSFAVNACVAISKNPGKTYNPCLLYGGVGLGKTHLIQAIGNSLNKTNKDLKIIYATAENFTNEFIQKIKNNKMQDFKKKYRNVDVLLLDDIHFLQNKVSTQEELFHTFNALYDYNKQMVFTCDRPVSELHNLTDRLRSRFTRGLTVNLQPPEYETRVAILHKKLEVTNKKLDDDILEFVCHRISTNVRDLEAGLMKLIAYSDLFNKKLTLSKAKELLEDLFLDPIQDDISIDKIQKVVSDFYNLSQNDLRSKKRTKAIVLPRQVAMYITREITEYSTSEIGLEFGGRDHTTVMHAIQRVKSKIVTEPSLEAIIKKLIKDIKSNNGAK